MPVGDNKKPVQVTRKEWDDLMDMVRDMYNRLCGNEKLGQRGMFDEHMEMYQWYMEQKWWGKKLAAMLGIIGGIIGIVSAIISLLPKK